MWLFLFFSVYKYWVVFDVFLKELEGKMTNKICLRLSDKQKFWMLSLLLLFIYSLFRYSDVVFSTDYSLTNFGDGIGTVSGIFALNDLVRNGDWSYIFSDMAHFPDHAQALASAGPFSQTWKLIVIVFGTMFSPETTYDVVGMIGYFCALVSGFILFRYLGANSLIAGILCITLASIDNNVARAQGHLFGLGVIFGPIITVYFTSVVSNDPSRRNLLFLAAAHLFNINLNEYYGFFGIFFTVAFFLINTAIRFRYLNFKVLFQDLVIASVFFILVASILYPNSILFPVLEKLGLIESTSVSVKTHVHDWNSFVFFSLSDVFHVFESDIGFINNLLNEGRFKSELWEMSYRIGIVCPTITIILLYTIYIKDSVRFVELIIKLTPWLLATLLLFLFSLSPSYSFSLVPFTYEIAPMLRVGVRALLYFDIGVLSIFTICLSELSKLLIGGFSKRPKLNRLKFAFLSVTLVLFVHNDVSKLDLFERMPKLLLPDATDYNSLINEKNGILIEVPYLSPIESPPEDNYMYLFHRIYHQKKLANQIYHGSNNTKYTEDLDRLSKNINSLTNDFLDHLILSGVDYFAVSHDMYQVEKVLRRSQKIEVVYVGQHVTTFKVKEQFSSVDTDVYEFLHKAFNYEP